ncbi:hypothetical protein H6F92_06235 [Microcystis wesenbergii FACHB-1317]|jgi:hypothetical protein|uniref:hypothetical protein n=1 Tax=Microcystis TaxID=1125 RepID=UPI000E364BA4|nr:MULTISPECIES: hypothetical protein [Microcystis]MBD2288436.1 hypothetical protein [Microcystis wesenbergii FACHB-1317]MEB3189455.1 hypothetical protein [Snowella sp.]REJ58005.1 MAG: hypothetical protein DWQ58_04065 [Microcystis aeruginosa TA09]UZO78641.1 hypothetical protein M8120_12645 [Microcystis aeruginosa str. Chao 1910]
MTAKEQLLQEIEKSSEPLLQEVLHFLLAKRSETIESPELDNDELDLSSDDPDRGQPVKDSFQQSLLAIQQQRIAGRPTISEEDISQRYGISI